MVNISRLLLSAEPNLYNLSGILISWYFPNIWYVPVCSAQTCVAHRKVGERILVDKPYNIKFHNMIEGCFFVTLIHFIFFINVNNANS